MNPNMNATWPATKSDDNDVLKQMSAFHPKASALKNTLPLLPGYGGFKTRSQNHRKQQLLVHTNGYRITAEPKKAAAEFIPSMQKITLNDIQRAHPSWLSLDNKILRFFCYYKEGVHESPEETSRIRRCHLYYYLEDDTMQITEPKQDNSGIAQGNAVKRHRVPRVQGTTEFYSVDDLDIGADIVIYSKVLHIVDCDAFTRDFYSKLGKELKPYEDYPSDAHEEREVTKKFLRDPNKPKLPEHRELKRYNEYAAGGFINLPNRDEVELAQSFYENDRKVLKFNAVWDDRATLHGDLRNFVILYFLADHTVKVMEVYEANGRDPFPVFLQRGKLAQVKCPAAERSLETLSSRPQQFVTDKDLGIGKTLNVGGRPLLMVSCDDYTQKYYAHQYKIYDFTPIDLTAPKPAPPKMQPPKHFGFGSPEDSLVSWKHLVLKAPRKDLKRMQERSKDVLRFGGYIESQPERRLILVFYAADDTLSVFEEAGRNTGFTGGKFLQRQRVKKPMEGNATLTCEAPYYEEDDFFVGATLNINGHMMVIDQTDEHTVDYMEGVPPKPTVEKMERLIGRFRTMMLERFTKLTDAFRAMDMDHDGNITLEELRITCARLNLDLTEHEVLSVMKYMDEDGDGSVQFAEFVRRMCPKDYEGELDEGKGIIPVQDLAQAGDRTYSKVAHGKAMQAKSDKVFKIFRDKLTAQRFVFLDLFRMMSNRAFDSLVGEKEFRYGVETVLQVHFTEDELQMLLSRFFPYPGKRLTAKEFNRLMNSGPHFETTK